MLDQLAERQAQPLRIRQALAVEVGVDRLPVDPVDADSAGVDGAAGGGQRVGDGLVDLPGRRAGAGGLAGGCAVRAAAGLRPGVAAGGHQRVQRGLEHRGLDVGDAEGAAGAAVADRAHRELGLGAGGGLLGGQQPPLVCLGDVGGDDLEDPAAEDPQVSGPNSAARATSPAPGRSPAPAGRSPSRPPPPPESARSPRRAARRGGRLLRRSCGTPVGSRSATRWPWSPRTPARGRGRRRRQRAAAAARPVARSPRTPGTSARSARCRSATSTAPARPRTARPPPRPGTPRSGAHPEAHPPHRRAPRPPPSCPDSRRFRRHCRTHVRICGQLLHAFGAAPPRGLRLASGPRAQLSSERCR